MATLRRCHVPFPWDPYVEKTAWKRSRSGTPRRRRSDLPALAHDPDWDWDGARTLFTERAVNGEDRDCEVCKFEVWESKHSPELSGRAHATVSLLDIAQYKVTERRGRARSSIKGFEVIRVPKVVPISEETPGPADDWKLDEWEKLDASVFKRTYSEVALGLVEEGDPSNTSSSQLVAGGAEDDPWECL